MIVLDTNVVSELLRSNPNTTVVAWLDAQLTETLSLTAVTLAEVRYGIATVPDGRRRNDLDNRFEAEVVPVFADRILPFDAAASVHYARLPSHARAIGRPMSSMDGIIAATCSAHGAILATRDVHDFQYTGLQILDPWAA